MNGTGPCLIQSKNASYTIPEEVPFVFQDAMLEFEGKTHPIEPPIQIIFQNCILDHITINSCNIQAHSSTIGMVSVGKGCISAKSIKSASMIDGLIYADNIQAVLPPADSQLTQIIINPPIPLSLKDDPPLPSEVEEPVLPVEEPVLPVEEPVLPVEESYFPIFTVDEEEDPPIPSMVEPIVTVEEPALPLEEQEEPITPVETPCSPFFTVDEDEEEQPVALLDTPSLSPRPASPPPPQVEDEPPPLSDNTPKRKRKKRKPSLTLQKKKKNPVRKTLIQLPKSIVNSISDPILIDDTPVEAHSTIETPRSPVQDLSLSPILPPPLPVESQSGIFKEVITFTQDIPEDEYF